MAVTPIDVYTDCTVCDKKDSQLCTTCSACAYCSKECQMKDWPSHKLICFEFRDFQDQHRPSADHIRGLAFPENDFRPRMTWLKLRYTHPEILSGYSAMTANCLDDARRLILQPGEIGNEVADQIIAIDEISGDWRTLRYFDKSRIVRLHTREPSSHLGRSAKNQAIEATASAFGPVEKDVRGTIVAAAMIGDEEFGGGVIYGDINAWHLRYITDYFVWFKGGSGAKVDRKLNKV